MTRMIRSALVATAVAVLAMATASTPSIATNHRVSTVVLHDGRDDVWIGTIDTENPKKTSLPAADVLTARITHGPHAVLVRERFGDLRRVGQQWFSFEISTPRNDYKGVVVSRSGHRQGRHQLFALHGRNGCRGFTHHIDYDTNIVSMRVPRSCLGHPRWVRVTVWSLLFTGPEPTDAYMDNPHDHQGFPKSGTGRLYPHRAT